MFRERQLIAEIAELLSWVCTQETLAEILNATICADADERLTDRQAKLAERLFGELTDRNPEAVSIASRS